MPQYPAYRLSNGLTVVVIDSPRHHQVLISLMVRVGSRFESPGENGASHFLEHMLFRGNSRFPDTDSLNRAFEDAGGLLQAHTGVEDTTFSFVVHPERLDHGLDCLSVFVREPTFPDLDKEREILLEELQYDYNEHGQLTNLAILGGQLMWPDHPLGQSVGGDPARVGLLTRESLRSHHARYYTPDAMVLSLAGPVRLDSVRPLVERHFGGGWVPSALSRTAPVPAPPGHGAGPLKKSVLDADNQFHLQLSYPAPGYNHPQELGVNFLMRTLDDGPTSRLQRVIREDAALVYHIGADYSGYWDTGVVDIATSVRAERLGPLLEHLAEVIREFRAQGPTPDEVERARLRYRYALEFSRDSLSDAVDRHAWPLLFSTVRTEEEELQQVQALTRDDLAGLAKSLFRREHLHLAVVGPLDPDSEALLNRALEIF